MSGLPRAGQTRATTSKHLSWTLRSRTWETQLVAGRMTKPMEAIDSWHRLPHLRDPAEQMKRASFESRTSCSRSMGIMEVAKHAPAHGRTLALPAELTLLLAA